MKISIKNLPGQGETIRIDGRSIEAWLIEHTFDDAVAAQAIIENALQAFRSLRESYVNWRNEIV